MKDVYFYKATNEISFIYTKGESVCFAEADGTIEEFLEWMKEDFIARDIPVTELPKVRIPEEVELDANAGV